MILDPNDQEIFEGVLEESFFKKYGKQQGIEIIKDLYKLFRKLAKYFSIRGLPIAHLYRHAIYLQMEMDQKDGGYRGLSVKEIAKRENVGGRRIYNIITRYAKRTRANHRKLKAREKQRTTYQTKF